MKQIIIGTDNVQYRGYRKVFANSGLHNGAYYYAKEIETNIIPLVKTNRNWDCLGMRFTNYFPHSIVFLHHNLSFDKTYGFLKKYDDLVLVASSWLTYSRAQDAGFKVIFLPLSIDVDYVRKFATEKTKEACYAGNKWKFKEKDLEKYLPKDIDFPPADLPREELLKFIAPYKRCYAVGRCALEAKALGCEIGVCDSRYPDPNFWKLISNQEAAKILQQELDKIDS